MEQRITKCWFYKLCIYNGPYYIMRVKYDDGFEEDLASVDNSLMLASPNKFVGLTKKEALELIYFWRLLTR